MRKNKNAWYIGFLAIVFAISCTGNDPQPNGQPIVTDAGTPVGTATSASIGASGGKLSSADGLVTLDIPAGALDAVTTISIQPITNMAPQGIAGVAYRFSPDGQTFKTPIKLTFKYTDDMLKGSSSELLWVVTQAKDGSWQAMQKSSVNTSTKTVTGEITHFSDWGLGKFIDLSLDPTSSFVKTGQSVNLSVAGFIASTDPAAELTPLAPLKSPAATSDDLVPLSHVLFETGVSTYKLVKWSLSGEGTLTPNGWNATYTAPSKAPANNKVTVTLEMQRYENGAPAANFGKVLLVATIIISEEGILVFNFNGTEYRFKQTGDPNQVAAVVVDDEYVVWQGASATGIPNFVCYRSLKSTGSHAHQCEEAADAPTFIYSPMIVYRQEWYDDQGKLYCASFNSNITEFGTKFGENIVGTFSGNLYNDKGQLFPVSGYFNLKRIN